MNLYPQGFHTAPYELFFKKEPDYSFFEKKKECFDLIAEMNNISICVLDFYRHEYSYISNKHLFLCGYSWDETKILGEKLAEKIIHEDDRKNQLEMKDAACLFFANLSTEKQKQLSLFTSHRLRHKNGNEFLVSNQYKPILFDDNGKMWMSLCLTHFATKNHKIESYIEISDTNERYMFSSTKKKFIKTKSFSLSTKEQNILLLSSQGFSSKEIAQKKDISLSTVKFHKQNILIKLNVRNISEAVLYAQLHNLF